MRALDLRDIQLREGKHRSCGSSAVLIARLRTTALPPTRSAGFVFIRLGLQMAMHNINVLLAIDNSLPEPNPYLNLETALGGGAAGRMAS